MKCDECGEPIEEKFYIVSVQEYKYNDMEQTYIEGITHVKCQHCYKMFRGQDKD